MIILGIDPGYERLGISIIESGPKPRLVFSETFKTSIKDEHSQRLSEIHKEIEKVIKKYKPKRLGIETLFFNKNVKTAIKVAEARGIILALSKKNGLEIREISPQQIKVAVTGYGNSDKKAIKKMVSVLIELPKNKKGNSVKLDDEIDAIAAGLSVLN